MESELEAFKNIVERVAKLLESPLEKFVRDELRKTSRNKAILIVGGLIFSVGALLFSLYVAIFVVTDLITRISFFFVGSSQLVFILDRAIGYYTSREETIRRLLDELFPIYINKIKETLPEIFLALSKEINEDPKLKKLMMKLGAEVQETSESESDKYTED